MRFCSKAFSLGTSGYHLRCSRPPADVLVCLYQYSRGIISRLKLAAGLKGRLPPSRLPFSCRVLHLVENGRRATRSQWDGFTEVRCLKEDSLYVEHIVIFFPCHPGSQSGLPQFRTYVQIEEWELMLVLHVHPNMDLGEWITERSNDQKHHQHLTGFTKHSLIKLKTGTRAMRKQITSLRNQKRVSDCRAEFSVE